MHTHQLLSSPCLYPIQTLPLSQACGAIVGYEVTLFYNNSTWTLLNLSHADLCNEMQCRLTSSLKDVSSVSASALNSRGATAPSHLAVPTQGISCPDLSSDELIIRELYIYIYIYK